ncbi:neuronal acetylcholine receptor subunit alpha-7-like [Saccostrea echinata]|uniref:neuronal acetylcholine receptor subunit alpha-7-like n=1 Tax=Saccostrea echinata TaxID=191078 RepID=UPI002A7F0F71|nr:neuronal acetylcholine receptor subunit alpha-7-like [Saccostrea echinata]
MNLTLLILFSIFGISACSSNIEHQLFENYSSMIKPRKNKSESVHVSFYFSINSVHEVEERLQYISFFGWCNVQWYDEFLTWNETQHSGLKMISVPYQNVWTPDISMWYTEENVHGLEPHPYVTVNSNGHVIWYPGGKIILSCDIKVSRFPFDEQCCKIIVGAWQITDWVQKLVPKSRTSDDANIISQNGEWIFMKFTFTEVYNAEFHLTTVVYELHFKRRYLYIILTIFIPIIILAVLNSLTFFVPVHSGERITYSLTLFLTFTVFLTLFEETMPRNSTDVPYLTIYVGFHLLLCVISTIISVLLKPFKKPIIHHDQSPNTEKRTKKHEIKNEKSYINDKSLEIKPHDEVEGRCHCGCPKVISYEQIDSFMILFNISVFISSTVILFMFYYI